MTWHDHADPVGEDSYRELRERPEWLSRDTKISLLEFATAALIAGITLLPLLR